MSSLLSDEEEHGEGRKKTPATGGGNTSILGGSIVTVETREREDSSTAGNVGGRLSMSLLSSDEGEHGIGRKKMPATGGRVVDKSLYAISISLNCSSNVCSNWSNACSNLSNASFSMGGQSFQNGIFQK
jgi:hypothetical protein